MLSAAVGDVIAGNRRDDDVLEIHSPDSLGHALRFILLEGERLGRVDRTESAGTRAPVSRDHHGRGATAPALPTIRALGALADRVEPEIGDHRLGREEDGIGRQADFDPVWLALLMESRVDL